MSDMIYASSSHAHDAIELFSSLQQRFREGLDRLSALYGDGHSLVRTEWLRDSGVHGGGWRYEGSQQGILNRGSLNISSVHYDDLPDKRLSSATALSCIVHPKHPLAPSLHTHISWTELRGGQGGWRLMADLNPSHPSELQKKQFLSMINASLLADNGLSTEELEDALAQGDRYFHIPALNRHRGVAHYYLEQWRGKSWALELELAQRFGQKVIDTYLNLVEEVLSVESPPTPQQYATQLDYHSVYFLQVLTLDRGTSSGILVHNQNDVGILGSLPQVISVKRLREWTDRLPFLQAELLRELIAALGSKECVELTPEVRGTLAQADAAASPRPASAPASMPDEHVQTSPPTVAARDTQELHTHERARVLDQSSHPPSQYPKS